MSNANGRSLYTTNKNQNIASKDKSSTISQTAVQKYHSSCIL